MRLAVHGYRLEGHQTGVARYLACLLREWEREPGPFTSIRVFSRLPAAHPRVDWLRRIRHVSLTPRLPYFACEQLLLRWCARSELLFCPANTIPIGHRGPCVVTIHDTLQEVVPETFGWWSRWRHAPLYRHSARRASRILTVSENSKGDIIRLFGVPERKVRVIPLAAAPCFRPVEPAAIPRPYVLFVGKLSARRDIPALLRAFARQVALGRPHALVLVGANHLRVPLHRWVRDTGLSDRVLHRPRVEDEELAALYSGAECLVLPSAYEGFGLPLLEAMACGCPAITYRNSSLAEVGGDAAYYSTPGEDGLATALREVLDSPSVRADLRRRGLRRAAEFSWQRTAQETAEALTEAAA